VGRGVVREPRETELDPSSDIVQFLAPDAPVTLTNCDREPIHQSGAIQPHGVLLALTEPDLVITWTSENTGTHLGIPPTAILDQPVAAVLGESAARQLGDRLRDPRASGTDPFSFQVASGTTLEATWHRVDGLVILELEPPIGEGGALMSLLFADVRNAMQALQSTDGVQSLCDAAAREIKQLTGHDRVMVYRFHPDGHGEVVSEAREPHQEAFLGLHYPASDIPVQARRLYMLNHLRVIADVAYRPVPLLSRQPGAPTGEAGEHAPVAPLDLSLSALRSVSPLHLEYLATMRVGATLTISLMHGTRLWGMLACHHDSPRRIDAQMRAACRVLGQVFSLQIAAHENQERHAYRTRLAELEIRLLARMSGAASLADALVLHDPSPLLLADADGMVARIDGRTSTVGSVPPPEAVDALLTRLCEPEEPRALVCDNLPHRYDELAPFASLAAGVLAVPLTVAFEDFIMWFRGEQVVDQVWAGDPTEAKVVQEAASTDPPRALTLSPRSSFEAWATQVRGRSRPWVRAEVDTAFSLAGAVPELLLAQARDRLAHLALHDPLTALPNRGLLLDRGAQALALRERGGGPVTMMFIDLDKFKLVNDSLGHSAGDDLLVQAAGRLLAAIRDTDTVARIGGDEFVVMCQGPTLAETEILSERLVEAFRTPFVLDGQEVRVTASLGVAVAEEGATVGDLLRDADTAMYRAKHSGRNTAEPFTRAMRTTSLRRVEIETSLRPALEHGDFRLYFQPLLDTSGTLLGFEALTRWPLAGRGMVPPTEFIPVAEEAGLIGPLTDWVLNVGLRQLSGWRDRRPDLDLTLAVNITASQMTNARVQHSIDRTLNLTQLPPHALCLEISEGALVTDDPTNRAFLHHLREQGVRLSIDDFGTGYSSLSYLTKLPVHELKIDRAFVAGLPGHQGDMTVVASVVALAHQLGLRAVAEGVETREQLDALTRLGCDAVQGYLLARPMPAHEIDLYMDGIGHVIVEQTRGRVPRPATTRAP
jgi:diguanylate cyclase (GGDEF)-like protein